MKDWKDLKNDAAFLAKRNKAAVMLGEAIDKALHTQYPVETTYQYVVLTMTPQEAINFAKFIEKNSK